MVGCVRQALQGFRTFYPLVTDMPLADTQIECHVHVWTVEYRATVRRGRSNWF